MKLLFLTLLPFLPHWCQSEQGQHWTLDEQFQDKLPAAFIALWERSPVYTTGACALACDLQIGCQGYFYNERTETCKTSFYRYLVHGDEVPAPGYRQYRKKQALCPPGSMLHQPSLTCYNVITVNDTWTAARDRCRVEGGRLAVLDTTSKMDFFMQNFRNGTHSQAFYYLGGHRPYNLWNTAFPGGVPDHVWLSGIPVDWGFYKAARYAATTEPNNYLFKESVVVVRYRNVGQAMLYDADQNTFQYLVCEFSLV